MILTTSRIVCVNKDKSSKFRAFDLPIALTSKEDFKQPIFGANYICGDCQPLVQGSLPGTVHFKLCMYVRDFMNEAEWMNIIFTHLSAGEPILYGGQSKSGGHEFVVDGYNEKGLVSVNWDWNELLESAKIASITGGLFGVSNQLMTKAFSGNAKIDEKLQDAKKEVLEDMKVTFEAEKDPAVRATVNAQLDNIIPDSELRLQNLLSCSL